jgi:hypothetical protein
MPSYRRLQQFAIAISVASVIYNGAEGAVSIGFGAESSSKSLIFFGIQSGIEVISAILVVWRFRKVAQPGEERGVVLGAEALKFVLFFLISNDQQAHVLPGSKSLRRFASVSSCWRWGLPPNRWP